MSVHCTTTAAALDADLKKGPIPTTRLAPRSDEYNSYLEKVKATLLEMLNPENDPAIAKLLGKIMFSLNVSSCKELLVVMPFCRLDHTLRTLYKLGVRIPRAAFVVFRKNDDGSFTAIQTGGFINKFSNSKDRKKKHSEKASHHCSVKYSGFFIAVTYVPGYGWLITSKNSASSDSTFIKQAVEILGNLLNELPKDGTTSCFEILSVMDQVHGYPVLRNAAIHTCATKPTGEGFGTTIVPLCDNVPQADYWSVTLEQIEEIEKHRASLTYPKLLELLGMPSGGANHGEICGNVVEGLVIRFVCEDGTEEVLKIKFLSYMLNTFLVREFLAHLRKLGSPPAYELLLQEHVAKFLKKWSFQAAFEEVLQPLLRFAVEVFYGNISLDCEVRPLPTMGSYEEVVSDLPALHILAVQKYFQTNPDSLTLLGIDPKDYFQGLVHEQALVLEQV